MSNSSTDSCESDGSPAVKCSSQTAALSAAKSCPHVVDIERADSGVGSESSKSSKASVELRRAASLSKNSDSGSSSSGNQTERPSPAPSTPPMPPLRPQRWEANAIPTESKPVKTVIWNSRPHPQRKILIPLQPTVICKL